MGWNTPEQVKRLDGVTSSMKKEQDKIIRVVTEYPTCSFWVTLLGECGDILDNFAKICYERMLLVYGKQPGETIVISESDKSVFGHLVLSHAFIEFTQFAGLRLYCGNPPANTTIERLNAIERPMFDRFCEVNNVPEELIEVGWKEYLED